MTSEQQIKDNAAEEGKDSRTRWIILLLGAIAVLSLVAACASGAIAWREASENAQAGKTLAQDVRQTCDAEPLFSAANPDLCDDAVAVEKETVEVDDPEIDDPDPNDPEVQDEEIQESEIQEAEDQQREVDQPEIQDLERQDDEVQDEEIDDPSIPGEDGADATPEQISQSVAEYCNPRGDCRGPAGPQGPEGPEGKPGAPAVCDGAFVCEDELSNTLMNYMTGVQIVDLLRALGCEVAPEEGPGPDIVMSCTITGKP